MRGRIADVLSGSFGEGALVLAAAAIGCAAHEPFLFASLGPTAYELVERPKDPSSRLYNVIVGHMIGLGAGFFSLYVLSAWNAPQVMSAGFVAPARIWATALAAGLTTVGTLALKARQPAASATALLISLGAMQTERDAWAIVVGTLIVAALGEPLRRLRIQAMAAGELPIKH
jgi:HPP family